MKHDPASSEADGLVTFVSHVQEPTHTEVVTSRP